MKKVFITICLSISLAAHSQDSPFIRKMVDTLTSPYFWGRGYTNDGMGKAADFIAAQFKAFGLQPLSEKSFMQPFSFPVNTFPSRMELSINGVPLDPGKDFIMAPESRSVKGAGKLVQKDSTHFVDPANRIIVTLEKKLTWDVAHEVADYTGITIDAKSLKGLPIDIKANIENKFIKNFKTANICGYVKGTAKPDSIIFITAHYDHLGGMGSSTYFPGANDNASGTGLLLSLAQYYAAHPQLYSIGFLSFAGEEAGLIGSKYYTDNPLLPLKNISFLLNLDLEGTGDEGITVVNATEFPRQFQYMQDINNKVHYLAAVNARGKAANSDHYFFTENKVPSFFFYTLGGIKAYHDVFDKSATLPLNEVNDLSSFIKAFIAKIMGF